jgi:hypothetical protein
MPKTRKRKKGTTQRSTIGTMKSASTQSAVQQSTGTRSASINRALAQSASSLRGLIWPALVALGCWGLAVSFFFFSNDPNHVVFGALVVVMALLWTFSFGLRLRKMMVLRQK